jgi:hypothetical protein
MTAVACDYPAVGLAPDLLHAYSEPAPIAREGGVMFARVGLMGLALLIGACGAGKIPPQTYPDRATWTYPERVAESSGNQVINFIGTPFYALTKAVGCVATVLVATPVAIGLELGESPDRLAVRSELDRGVGTNCGGSYILRAS